MYKVTKKYGTGSELEQGKFRSEPEARKFIADNIIQDVIMKVRAIYMIYEGMDLLESIDSDSYEAAAPSEDASSAGKGSSQSFNPSPLQMSPRPGGVPPSSFKDDKQTKDKDKS